VVAEEVRGAADVVNGRKGLPGRGGVQAPGAQPAGRRGTRPGGGSGHAGKREAGRLSEGANAPFTCGAGLPDLQP